MFRFIIFLCCFFSFQSSHAFDWNPLPDSTYTTKQKALFTSYIALNVVDLSQSVHAFEGCGGSCIGKFEEANPLLGKNPSRNKLIIGKALGAYALSIGVKNMNPKRRTIALVVSNLIIAAVVVKNGRNAEIGFRIGF